MAETRRKVLIAVVVGIMVLEVVSTAPLIDFAVDARVYHDTARRLVRSQPLYAEAPRRLAHPQPLSVEPPRRNPYDVTSTFLYPPVVAALLRPVAFLELRTFLFL